ncbi:MAG: TRAM domain-containing protein [Gemmatimonadales bacterium]
MTDPQAETAVTIERIAAGGDGVGRWPDGRVVFVPRTAPGDRVVVTLVLDRPRYLKGELQRVVEPGPHRVTPSCAHYDDDQCGGCQLQHLDESAQQAAKRTIVGDALRRLAGLDVADPPIEGADEPWGYRRKITLSRAETGSFGFHRRQPLGSVFPLDHCRIAAPSLMEMWQVLRAHPEVIPRWADRLSLREDGTGGRHVVAHGVAPDGWPQSGACAALLESAGIEASIWLADSPDGARRVAGPEARVAGLAFEQINPAMGARVRRDAVARLGSLAGRHVWDLYAGIGETASLLVEAGAAVSCVELAGDAVRSAPEQAGVRWFEGPAETVVPGLDPPDLVITNPPRTGMGKAVIEALLAAVPPPERIVYLSCDPATMARDIKRLAGGFVVTEVTAYDLFPQTAHVEAVTLLERR